MLDLFSDNRIVRELQLRDYQIQAIEDLRNGVRQGMKRQVLVAPTGAGKTVIASHLLREADRKGSYALFLVDRVALVDQTSATLDGYGIPHGVIQGDHPRWEPRANIQVCSIQTLARRRLPRDPALICYDECFPGDVEVLTAGGFKRFDAITGDESFAQYDMASEGISFARASRLVKRPAAGDVYRIGPDRRIDLLVTGGHDLIVETKSRGRSKVRVDNFRPGDKKMPVAGFGTGKDNDLTAIERFMIAYQADGSLHHERKDGGAIAAFSFSKQRKIDALIEVARCAGLSVTEVAAQANASSRAKPRRRFMVSVPFVPHKRIWECFDLTSMSGGKAAAILTEANQWDGHVQKARASNWIITTTCRQAVNFYQAVAALGGMRATMTARCDDRSEAFSDCYRLFIVADKRHVGCQKMEPQPVEYTGDVYCVTVPTGCIVVRHNGKTLIVGNCHVRFKATMEYMDSLPACVKIGLTATPFTAGMGDDWDRAVNVRTTRSLIDSGHLVEPTIYVAKSPDDSRYERNSFGEFSDKSAASAGIEIVGDVVSEWQGKVHEHFGGPVKTIVFAATVEHGRELCQAFAAAGHNFQQISYLDKDDDERREKISEFRKPDSTITGLVSCGVLTRGFDVTDVQCGISCRPYRKSLSSHMQEIGRVMRPHGEGKRALWLCLAKGSKVLTNSGLKPIQFVTKHDKVWDGMEFVSHGGAICKGKQNVITYQGLTATENHLVHTVDGWRAFGDCARKQITITQTGLGGTPIRLCRNNFTGHYLAWSKKQALDSCRMRVRDLWLSVCSFSVQFGERTNKRLSHVQPAFAGISDVAVLSYSSPKTPMHELQKPNVERIWRARYRVSVSRSEGGDTLGDGKSGGSRGLQVQRLGPNRQRWTLRAGESSLVGAEGQPCEQEWGSGNRENALVPIEISRSSVCKSHYERPDFQRSDFTRNRGEVEEVHIHQEETEVWDILDAGPRNCFTCEGLLVHNCHSGNIERFAIDMFDVWEHGAGELSHSAKKDSTPRERTPQEREQVVCPECSGALRASVCMGCGWERPARSGIVAKEGELREFSAASLAMQPRPGLRAECLSEPREVWRAALAYTFERCRKGDVAARKWAYGIVFGSSGIYPTSKAPFGWFDAMVPSASDVRPDAYSLIDREARRFRKGSR